MAEIEGNGREGNHLTKRAFSKKNREISPRTFELGKIPPQARDLEEAVLGAMMLDKDAVSTVIDILKPDSFYVDSHREIYKAVEKLFNKSEPVDILTVTEQLRAMGTLEMVGGAYYVSEITNRVASAANIETHARIIAEKFIQRELIRISTQVIQDAYEDTTDVFDLLDRAEQGLFSITENNLKRSYKGMDALVKSALDQIQTIRNNDNSLSGIPSGFHDLDNLTSGWQRSDLVVVAARPGMGKTAFTLSVARNAAVDFKQPTVIFSLEMSGVQLVNRLISGEAEIEQDKLRKGDLASHEWVQLTTRVDKLSQAPIFIDDTPAINIFELRAKCRRLKMQHDIQLVIIDYLQLMTAGGGDSRAGNREQEISQISRALKSIAKELNVPILALSQLSRQVETRGGDKKPILSDLRESGAIEQDADIVLFIYRPEYYKITEDSEGRSLLGLGELIIAKHRNGALDSVFIKFIGKYARFSNCDDVPVFEDNDKPYPTKISQYGVESNAITRASKMNTDNGQKNSGLENLNDAGEVPF